MTDRHPCPPLAAALLALLPVAAGAAERIHPDEVHLSDLRQLTFGGENAEAYWSPDGRELSLQSTRPPYACDQIFRLAVPGPGDPLAEPTRVSTGTGRTTCAYFTHTGDRILFSSTHLAGPECPPPPDRAQGYVWALYDSYEIFTAKPDGTDLVRLTDNSFYDAEATVCPVDGSIVFTSTRDGDLELYRMKADGSEVKRLTHLPGYDGGAFFSADCTQLVWRASRPRSEDELADYRRLLDSGLVRPSRLELWVADGDGTNARQVTYLGAASFAPYFYPSGDRIVFSSNHGQASPREFDLWAVDVAGTRLERISHTPDFDGFPIFSPDGSQIAFSSNRNQGAPGETNVFVASWTAGEPRFEPRAPDRYLADVAWLADDARGGRGLGTPELEASAAWLAERMAAIGLEPGGDPLPGGGRSYLQRFEAPTAVEVAPGTALAVDGAAVAAEDFRPAAFSASADAAGPVVLAGWGITAPEKSVDDYAGLDVTGKIVLVRRFVPAQGFADEADERRYGDLRYKAWNAREHGAVGLIVADLPPPAAPGEESEAPEEAPLPGLRVEAPGDAGLPVAIVKRAVGERLAAAGRVELAVRLARPTTSAANVVGRLPAGAAASRPGGVLVGAHYDHLGLGGPGSLAPDARAPHNGADDNASGTAALLEAARTLAARRGELAREVWFVAFSGEESGTLGSTHFVRRPPPGLTISGEGGLLAMINMDMVGRLRDNTLAVLGAESAQEWTALLGPACDRAGLLCNPGGDGYGPSDQTPFYAAGVPVVHLFTGAHGEYHKPSDDTARINAAGGAQVAALAGDLAAVLTARAEPLTYKRVAAPPPAVGDRRSYGAWLGTVPDYVGPPGGGPGVLLADVRPGSPAEAAGLARGDVLVGLNGREVGDIYDFVYLLRDSKPGQETTAVVLRGGQRLELKVTYGSRPGR